MFNLNYIGKSNYNENTYSCIHYLSIYNIHFSIMQR